MERTAEPTILEVNPHPGELDWDQEFLGRMDIPMLRCTGPHGPGECPILRGQPCGLINRADGILFQLDLDREDHRQILRLYIDTLDVPIRVVVPEDQQERYAELLSEVEVFSPPVGPSMLDAFAAEVESSALD